MKAKWDSPEPLIQPEPDHCKSSTFTPASKPWRNPAPVSWAPETRLPHNDPPLHCHPELRITAAGCSLKPKHNQGMEMIHLVSRRWEEERRTCVGNLLLDWAAAAGKSEEGFKRNEPLRLTQESGGKRKELSRKVRCSSPREESDVVSRFGSRFHARC